MARNPTLLLGNGINRLGKGYSWRALLVELAKIGKVKPEYLQEKPFTLYYDEVSLKASRPDPKLKEDVAGIVKEVVPNAYHEKVMESGVANILTTNYEYALENATPSTPAVQDNVLFETTYSLFRRRKVGKTHIWHVHGEVGAPNSITLGHSHYAGYLQKMRRYLTSGYANSAKELIQSPYASMKRKRRRRRGVESWLDLFLSTDVYIVGLGMDYTEIDLWWLMIEKARRRKQKRKSIGDTFFVVLKDEARKTAAGKTRAKKKPEETPQERQARARLSLLKSYGVKIVEIGGPGQYTRLYDYVLTKIRKPKEPKRSGARPRR